MLSVKQMKGAVKACTTLSREPCSWPEVYFYPPTSACFWNAAGKHVFFQESPQPLALLWSLQISARSLRWSAFQSVRPSPRLRSNIAVCEKYLYLGITRNRWDFQMSESTKRTVSEKSSVLGPGFRFHWSGVSVFMFGFFFQSSSWSWFQCFPTKIKKY